MRRTSNDPMIRLQRADKWPVVRALAGAEIWENGIGDLAIARQESEGQLVFGVYLVDVFCLGVKNALWRTGTLGDFEELIGHIEQNQTMHRSLPLAWSRSSRERSSTLNLLASHRTLTSAMPRCCSRGSIPRRARKNSTFGQDGRPLYIQGPHESPAEVMAIVDRVQLAGGHYTLAFPGAGLEELAGIEGGFGELEWDHEDDSADESRLRHGKRAGRIDRQFN